MADGKLVIETELGTKTFDAQYKQLETELKAKQKRLNELLKVKASGGDIDKAGLNADIVKTEAGIEKLTNKMLDLKLKTKDTGDESEDTGKKFDFNFKKMGNTVKKFALALVGLRTAYALVSRASSAYLSQDTELAGKLKSVWVGLGSFLAPVLEFISNALLKALGYLNVFIKALTGIDFLARANAKALKAQASAQKELNNQTYDFDVIRKQQDTSSSGGSGVGSGELFDIPELDEKIVKKLQDMAGWLKENWHWIKKVGEALLLVFGASAIGKILKNIGKLLGLEGLGGLNSVLTTLAQIGVIVIAVDLLYSALTGRDLVQDLKNIKDGLKELAKQTEKNSEAEKGHSERLVETHQKIIDLIEAEELSDDMRQLTTQHLKEQTNAIETQIGILEDNALLIDKDRTEQNKLKDELKSIIDVYDALYEQNKLNDEETEEYMDTIADLIFIKKRLGEKTEYLEEKYEDLRIQTGKDKDANYELKDSAQAIEDKYKELTGNKWKINLQSDTGEAEHNVTGFVRWLNDLVKKPFTFWMDAQVSPSSAGSSGGGYSSGGGRHYALGGIVTQPTRALIGEAGYPEAVVPMTADYLSTLASEISRYGGSSGGTQPINIYFDGRLIQRQTASRENQRNFITNT